MNTASALAATVHPGQVALAQIQIGVNIPCELLLPHFWVVWSYGVKGERSFHYELSRFPEGSLPKSWQCSFFGNVPLRRRAGGNCHQFMNLRLTRRRNWFQKGLRSSIKFGSVAKFLFLAAPTIARGGGTVMPNSAELPKNAKTMTK